jgi:hypothetical protein
MKELYKIAFQFQITPSPSAPPTTYYFVNTDPLSPAIIPFSSTPLLESKIFIHTPKDGSAAKTYTILFPHLSDAEKNSESLLQTFSIPKDTPVTRGEMTAMPDYSLANYWKFHYDASPARVYEWFLPWNAVSSVIKTVLPPTIVGGVVLNVGCGNSKAGEGMLKDNAASLVVSVDVAESALTTLAKLGNSSRKGVEEFALLDATELPFREPKSKSNLFDWAFDKGTLDGLLYSSEGVALVQKVWNGVAKLTDTFVLVSLGRPENRLALIEDQIKGWEVDQCMEIELKGGAVGMAGPEGSGLGKIDRCWVYVCKRI